MCTELQLGIIIPLIKNFTISLQSYLLFFFPLGSLSVINRTLQFGGKKYSSERPEDNI